MNSIDLDNHPIYFAEIRSGSLGYLCRKDPKISLVIHSNPSPIICQYMGQSSELSPDTWLGNLLSTSFTYKGLLYKPSLEIVGNNTVKIKLEIL
jgi:hypothetical protein